MARSQRAPGSDPVAPLSESGLRCRAVGTRYSIPQKTPSGTGANPEGAGAPVPQVDLAPGRWTAQSSASPTKIAGYTRPTALEMAPFWAIDLGAVFAVASFAAELAPLPPRTVVRLFGYTIPAKDDEPPVGSCIAECTAGELSPTPRGAMFRRDLDVVARFLRIELVADESPVELALRDLVIFGSSPFGASLRASYERAFALFAARPLFRARRTPEGPFETTHTYADVWAAAQKLARALAARLEPSTKPRIFLGIATRTRAEWLVTEVACLLRGYVVVPLAPSEPEERLQAIVDRCPLDVLVCDAPQAPMFRRIVGDEGWVIPVADEGEPFSAVGPVPEDAPPAAPRAEDDLFTLLFTSGSTGVPKGAMRSYRKCNALLQSYGVPQPGLHLSFQPLSHLSERHYWPALVANGAVVGLSRGGPHVLSDLAAFEPSWVSSVPRLFDVVRAGAERAMAEAKALAPWRDEGEIEAEVLRRTRLVFGRNLQGVATGSAPVSPETWRFLERCFGDIWVGDSYGSTEVGTITGNRRVPAGVEVKLAPVPGLSLPQGQGEILVRSPHVIDGYFGDAAASAAALSDDGFFRTGDIGEQGPDGLRVVGRVASTVKLGQGEPVSLERVEAAIGGASVVDRVIAHPHPSGASLVALVVPKVEELSRLCGVECTDLDALCADPGAAQAVLDVLRARGERAGLPSRELPTEVVLAADAAGLLTVSGKVSRQAAGAHVARAVQARLSEKRGGANAQPATPLDALLAIASAAVGRPLSADARISADLGLDSLAAAEILAGLSTALGRPVPLDAWFAAETLRDLAAAVTTHQARASARAELADADRRRTVIFPARTIVSPPRRVLLTGATGLLGAHLLEALLARTEAHVVCLVRAESLETGRARLRQVRARYRLDEAPDARWSVVAADLAAATPKDLACGADTVIHAAASVNWLARYDALRGANVLGTETLLRLAASEAGAAFHHVSTISTAPADGDEASLSSFDAAAAGSGYALSKWVAECIVRSAQGEGAPVFVHRPGLITGHAARGIGNGGDFVHRYLRACRRYGVLLARPERLDMTPVSYVAEAIVAALLDPAGAPPITHLCNVQASPSFAEAGRGVAGSAARALDYEAFRQAAVLPRESPLHPLASYFPASGFGLGSGPWPDARTRAWLAERGVVCPVVDAAVLARYGAALDEPLSSSSC